MKHGDPSVPDMQNPHFSREPLVLHVRHRYPRMRVLTLLPVGAPLIRSNPWARFLRMMLQDPFGQFVDADRVVTGWQVRFEHRPYSCAPFIRHFAPYSVERFKNVSTCSPILDRSCKRSRISLKH